MSRFAPAAPWFLHSAIRNDTWTCWGVSYSDWFHRGSVRRSPSVAQGTLASLMFIGGSLREDVYWMPVRLVRRRPRGCLLEHHPESPVLAMFDDRMIKFGWNKINYYLSVYIFIILWSCLFRIQWKFLYQAKQLHCFNIAINLVRFS